MSGIFGTYHRSRQPADFHLWERLGKITAHRGPDGTGIKSSGPVLLGHNTLHTTLESLQEQLPYFCNTSGLAITADARIDNRPELLHALEISETAASPISDSRIILSAYAKWGEKSFQRLLGDFSFVIWDGKQQKLLCVRDPLGVKPFYYLLSDRLLAFSSEIKPLLMHPEASDTLNEGMVGEHLAAKVVSKTETLFRDIQRLAPAHFMVITPETLHIQRYWQPNFHRQLRYTTEEDYAEHFQELFSEAISCRLRSHLPISFELSGGLDSSSIVGMAHTLPVADRRDNFLTCSLTYPGLTCDEKMYVESMEKHHGIIVHYLDGAHSSVPDWSEQVQQTYSLPDPPNLSNTETLLQYVQQNNSRVLLSGIGGDEWFSGSDYTYLDLLLEKNYSAIARDVQRNFRKNRKNTCKKLSANLAWPLLPFPVKRALLHHKKKHSLYPPWISAPFANKINLAERIFNGFPEPYVANLARADLFGLFHSGYESNVLEKNDNQKARFQIEGRHPFLDRRLIEFALSLPNSLHQHNGTKKHLLRLASKSYLPACIRNRSSKAEFSQLYHRAFSSKPFTTFLNNRKTYENGWIDKQPLQAAYEKSSNCFQKNPSGPCPDTLPIWFAFSISTWYNCHY